MMNKWVQEVPRQLGTGFNQRCEPYLNTFTSDIFFLESFKLHEGWGYSLNFFRAAFDLGRYE